MVIELKKLYPDSLRSLNINRQPICIFLILSILSFNTKADTDFMIRGGLLSGLWSIDVNTDAYTSTGEETWWSDCSSFSFPRRRFFLLDLSMNNHLKNVGTMGMLQKLQTIITGTQSMQIKKYIAFLGLGTTGENMFSFISTRIGYIRSNLDLGNNILANNPNATYEGNGVKLSFFYKNIFQTLDWGIDLSLDLNYILYDSLSSNGSTTKLPGTIGNYTYSKLQELSGSFMLGISFTFLKDILEMQPGGEFLNAGR